jgi:hypothetical protein
MDKVFLVFSLVDNYWEVRGVFSSMSKASEFVARECENKSSIEIHIVDEPSISEE